jgi:uncharacterized protein
LRDSCRSCATLAAHGGDDPRPQRIVTLARPMHQRESGTPPAKENLMNPELTTVQEIYAAFGRGDIAAILPRLAEDTDFGFVTQPDDVPWHKPVRGRANVPSFFQALADNAEILSFAPRSFSTSPGVVAVEITFLTRMRRSGREVQIDQMHVWNFDASGLVTRMRHYEDTAMVQAAYRG